MIADDDPFGWASTAAADAYRDRDMRLAEKLIFPAVLQRLGGGSGPDRLVLDIGCGTGAIAAQLAGTGEWTVQALDLSADMLDIARADRPHPRISYRLFDGRTLNWLADNSVDAAVCCLVYCTDPDDGRLAGLTTEIHRVLRPGAPYLLADLNPAAPGWPSPPCATASRDPCTPTATPWPRCCVCDCRRDRHQSSVDGAETYSWRRRPCGAESA
ncbi:class I SAM-dependent methyltransferase [Streptomyces sp. NPDC058466]|uniref:class I SAM-dependent methyltransferase n=1 Tax=Streptomyces sp. NPDC058466 TaxID=3346512 RepID=UPI003653D94D